MHRFQPVALAVLSICSAWELSCTAQAEDWPAAASVPGQAIPADRSSRALIRWLATQTKHGLWHPGGHGQLPWATRRPTGRSIELSTPRQGRILLIVDSGLLVAIVEGQGIQMSVLRQGSAAGPIEHDRVLVDALPRPGQTRHLTAMSAEHLARKSPGMSRLFFYYTGPSQGLVPVSAVPASPWTQNLLRP